MADQDNKENIKLGQRGLRIIIGIVATILLGAIGSGVWDLIFKPKIGSFGRLFTSMSSNIDNSIFTTAALDPLPIPGIIIIMALVIIPLLFGFLLMFIGFGMPLLPKLRERLHRTREGESTESNQKRLKMYLRFLILFGVIYIFSLSFGAFIALSVLNESTLVWRTFHRNIDICAPYMAEDQRLKTIAIFRSMETRGDFERIKNSLNNIASKNNTQLNWYEKTP